jgi:hypothetical protein
MAEGFTPRSPRRYSWGRIVNGNIAVILPGKGETGFRRVFLSKDKTKNANNWKLEQPHFGNQKAILLYAPKTKTAICTLENGLTVCDGRLE